MLTLTKPAEPSGGTLHLSAAPKLACIAEGRDLGCGDCFYYRPLAVEGPVAGRCFAQKRPGVVGRSLPICVDYLPGKGA